MIDCCMISRLMRVSLCPVLAAVIVFMTLVHRAIEV